MLSGSMHSAVSHASRALMASLLSSLNLATAVGIVLYEALRQLHDW